MEVLEAREPLQGSIHLSCHQASSMWNGTFQPETRVPRRGLGRPPSSPVHTRMPSGHTLETWRCASQILLQETARWPSSGQSAPAVSWFRICHRKLHKAKSRPYQGGPYPVTDGGESRKASCESSLGHCTLAHACS